MGNDNSSGNNGSSDNNNDHSSNYKSIDPGPEHCAEYNLHFSNAEYFKQSAGDAPTAFNSIIDTFHSAYEYSKASEHANHGPGCTEDDKK